MKKPKLREDNYRVLGYYRILDYPAKKRRQNPNLGPPQSAVRTLPRFGAFQPSTRDDTQEENTAVTHWVNGGGYSILGHSRLLWGMKVSSSLGHMPPIWGPG